MENLSRIFTKCIVFLSLYIAVTHAIRCYECNSEQDPRCLNPARDFILGRIDCDLKAVSCHNKNLKPMYCRTATTQFDFGTKVVRSCSFHRNEGDEDCVTERGIGDINTTFCYCHSDLCNA